MSNQKEYWTWQRLGVALIVMCLMVWIAVMIKG